MRKYHRWISTVGMVLILYVAATGTILAISEIMDPSSFAEPTMVGGGMGAGRPMGNVNAAPLPGSNDVERMTATVVRAALATAPDMALNAVRVRLRMQNDQPLGIVTLGGATSQTLAFNAATGEPTAVPSEPEARGMGGGGMGAGMMGEGMGGPGGMGPGGMGPGERGGSVPLSAQLQEIHSGAIVGRGGQWFVLATGVSLIILSFTGIWMYFEMLLRRRKNGRMNWFWS